MRHIKRRVVMVFLLGAVIWSCNRDKRDDLVDIHPSTLPYEGVLHQKTWMTFQGSNAQKQNLILIASTIAQYEPVTLIVHHKEYQELLTLLGDLNAHHYPIEVLQSQVNSPYVRDEGPTFVYNTKESLAGIDFNYKHLGQEEDSVDANTTQFILSQTSIRMLPSNLIVKASCISVDGAGTAIITENCIINDELNPYWEKSEIETELKTLLGLQKIIWIKGIDTNSNGDTIFARFAKEGVILTHRNNKQSSDAYEISRENIQKLQNQKDALDHPLKVIILDAPKESNESYLGYYLCNQALIMQRFGEEEADYKTYKILQGVFNERSIEQLTLNSEGKNITSVTLQEPKL